MVCCLTLADEQIPNLTCPAGVVDRVMDFNVSYHDFDFVQNGSVSAFDNVRRLAFALTYVFVVHSSPLRDKPWLGRVGSADQVDTEPFVNCSADRFYKQDTTVTCEARDNESPPNVASCTFIVRVNGPALAAPARCPGGRSL